MLLLNRRRMLDYTEKNIILIKSDALEQGTLRTDNGNILKSNYRVRTKDFINLEKGRYKITCNGAIQGNVLEYDGNKTFRKTHFHVHTKFPLYITIQWSSVKISVSNGAEGSVNITPPDVKYIKIEKNE